MKANELCAYCDGKIPEEFAPLTLIIRGPGGGEWQFNFCAYRCLILWQNWIMREGLVL